MVASGSVGFWLARIGRSDRILVVVLRSVIQIRIIVRIVVGSPVKRPGKLLNKKATASGKETAVLVAREVRTKTEVIANAGPHPKAAIVEGASQRGCVRGSG